MKKIVSVLMIALLVIALPASVLAQDSDGTVSPEPVDPAPIEPYYDWWYDMGGFEYGNGTADGTYVDFEIDESSGEVSDYTVKMVYYDYYYPGLYYEGDEVSSAPSMPEPQEFVVKLFDSIRVENFTPNGHPAAFGQELYYMGESVLMSFWDSEWSSASYRFGGNMTMTFDVADGLELTDRPYWYDMYEVDEDEWANWSEEKNGDDREDIEPLLAETGTATSGDGGASLDMDYYNPYYWQFDEVWLQKDNITCSIWVDGGIATIVDSDTVTINVTGNSYVSFSAWYNPPIDYCYCLEYFEDDYDRGLIETALEEGLIAAVGYLFVDEHSPGSWQGDSTAYNDPSFEMSFIDVDENGFKVEVDSAIREGRVVSVNLNKGALNITSAEDIMVLLDDAEVTACRSLEDLMAMKGSTEAGYYFQTGQSQNMLFVYVPHFSKHTITVETVAGSESALGASSIVLPGVLAVAFIAVAAALVVRRNRGRQDDGL